MTDTTTDTKRQTEIRAFVRAHFGLMGTLRLHRAAIGADLLRAPANVLLAPVLIVVRLAGLLAQKIGFDRTARWLLQRRVLLQTSASRRVAVHVVEFIAGLDAKGIGVTVPDHVLEHEIVEYTGVRNAVGEITTTILVLIGGFFVFRTATPGLFSLIGPVAEFRAHNLAVEQFPLGQGMGKMYYAVFSASLETWQLVVTGVMLAMVMSIVTTFAGVIVDPIQVITGTHRRRLSRLVTRLEVGSNLNNGLAREHITARFADLTDMALNLWRFIRG